MRTAVALIIMLACAWVDTVAAEDTRTTYNLPGGDAAAALRQFTEHSGRDILFAAEIVRGVKTNPVRGEFTATEALNLMLAGTGLGAVPDERSSAFAVRKLTEPKPGQVPGRPVMATDEAASLNPVPDTSHPTAIQNPHTMNRRKPLGLLGALLAFTMGGAQPAPAADSVAAPSGSTGSIIGRVFDERTGRSLEGAIVRVVGTSAIDYTTTDGRFSVSAPAGSVRLEVEYVGLDTAQHTVTVAPGVAARIDVPMTSNVHRMDSFVVQESVRGQALAINMQKVAAGIVNIVSEETFGQMTDGNVGNALQRLPGISVDEGADGAAESINIRGVSGDYNSFQVDGNRAPNSPGGIGQGPTQGSVRSFDPRQLAADGITNIEVIKAPTPDRDGDAIGGIVNVVSRSAFQRDGRDFKLKLSGTLNDLSDEWGHAASLSYSDIFSLAGKEKNLGVSLTVSSYKTDRYFENRDMDWKQVTPEDNPQLSNLGQYDFPVWLMEQTHWNFSEQETKTQTVSGSIDFRTDEHNSFYFRPIYTYTARKGLTQEAGIRIDSRFQDVVGGRKTIAALEPNYGRGTPGSTGSQGSRRWIGGTEENNNTIYSAAFGGKHERDSSVLNYDFYYATTKYRNVDQPIVTLTMAPNNPWIVWEYTMRKPSEGLVDINVVNGVDTTNLGLMTVGDIRERSAVKLEDVYSAKVDWEKKFTRDRGLFTFKTGAKYRRSEPEYERHFDQYAMNASYPYASVMFPTDRAVFNAPMVYGVNTAAVQELLRTSPQLYTRNVTNSIRQENEQDYVAQEETTAGYVMGTLQTGPHTIIGGVRFEQNDWSSVRKLTSFVGGATQIQNIPQGTSYSYWLPGLHLRHELRKNLILRESFNQSYGRPRLSEITRGLNQVPAGHITEGNPNLKPAFSNNFDLQLEFYTENGGLYSAGIFYKDVEDFHYSRVYRFNDLDSNGRPIFADAGLYTYTRPENGATATNYGLELIARQRLSFLPGPLKGLSAAVSATFTESEADYPGRTDNRKLPVEGFSAYLFTSSLEYVFKDFYARADYRYRDDFVEVLGSNIEEDEYYSAEEKVDLELGYRFSRGFSVFVSGTNLTNRPQVSYAGFRPFVEDTSFSGRKFTVGMEYRF